MEKITTREQLEAVCKELDKQGFGYISEYELSDRKLQHIIQEANTLNMDYNERDLKEKFIETCHKNYDEFTKAMAEHFGMFDKDSKAMELAHKIRPSLKKREKGDRKSRTRVRKDKSLTLSAHYKYSELNTLFKVM